MNSNCCSCSGIQGFGAGDIIPGLTLPSGWTPPPNFIPASQADLAATNAEVNKNSEHIKYLSIGGAVVAGLIVLLK